MIALALSMLIVGAALGTRFKVLVLVPAIGWAFATVMAAGLARGDHAPTIAVAMILAACAVQIGYLFGLILPSRLAPMLTLSRRKAILQTRFAR